MLALVLILLVTHSLPLKKEKTSGVEPGASCSAGRRLNHYANGTMLLADP